MSLIACTMLAAMAEGHEPDARPKTGVRCKECGYTNDAGAWYCGVCGVSPRRSSGRRARRAGRGVVRQDLGEQGSVDPAALGRGEQRIVLEAGAQLGHHGGVLHLAQGQDIFAVSFIAARWRHRAEAEGKGGARQAQSACLNI